MQCFVIRKKNILREVNILIYLPCLRIARIPPQLQLHHIDSKASFCHTNNKDVFLFFLLFFATLFAQTSKPPTTNRHVFFAYTWEFLSRVRKLCKCFFLQHQFWKSSLQCSNRKPAESHQVQQIYTELI